MDEREKKALAFVSKMLLKMACNESLTMQEGDALMVITTEFGGSDWAGWEEEFQ